MPLQINGVKIQYSGVEAKAGAQEGVVLREVGTRNFHMMKQNNAGPTTHLWYVTPPTYAADCRVNLKKRMPQVTKKQFVPSVGGIGLMYREMANSVL